MAIKPSIQDTAQSPGVSSALHPQSADILSSTEPTASEEAAHLLHSAALERSAPPHP